MHYSKPQHSYPQIIGGEYYLCSKKIEFDSSMQFFCGESQRKKVVGEERNTERTGQHNYFVEERKGIPLTVPFGARWLEWCNVYKNK